MERDVELFEACSRRRDARRRALSPSSTGRSRISVRSGLKSANGDGFDPPDGLARHAAAGALIGIGRIREAIADHPCAARKRRPDRPRDMIGARGEHHQRFRQHVPAAGLAFHQQFADVFRARRTARFARDDDIEPASSSAAASTLHLRRFAGALAAFERDEAAGRIIAWRWPEISARRPRNMRPKKPALDTVSPA